MALSKKLIQIALVLSAIPAAAFAGEMGTVYTQLSTNGLGLGYAASVSEGFAVRGQINALPKQTFTGDVGDFGAGNTMTVELNWSSAQLVGDWYPGSGGFRMSGGVVFNSSKITLAGNGNVNNKPATVNAEIKMSDGIAPYAGIGYSTKPKDAKGFGFVFDLGVMFQNPKSTLTATGAGVTQADIDAQNKKVQDAIDNLKVFPVFGIGLSYSF
ncbi:MAG: hypothetical protein RL392_1958 [Pseudomonadota bacterium]|jgi:hypothetical protein